MEKKEIMDKVIEILSKHEGNTSEGAIYWNFEWIGGRQIPTGGGGYTQEGGELVYADKAFYEEMADFIFKLLDKAREEGVQEYIGLLQGIEHYEGLKMVRGLVGLDKHEKRDYANLQRRFEQLSKLKQ